MNKRNYKLELANKAKFGKSAYLLMTQYDETTAHLSNTYFREPSCP